jgi:CPA2 family monovalent cation:H+ antiporter-2
MDGAYFGIFFDTLVILAAAVVGASLAERLKLGSIIGYLAAGLIIGPAFLDLIGDVHAPQALAELGIVFLLFTVGLELPAARLRQLPRTMFVLGALQVVATTAVLAGVAMLLGLSGPAAVAAGAALSLSSTAIVLRLLAERKELHSRLGRGALGILMTQDLAVGPLLVLIPALRGTPLEMAEAIGLSVLKAVAVTMLILGIGRIALRPVMNAVAASNSSEIFAALTLLIVLAAGAVTHLAGLSMAFGALLAGMLLADTAYRHQVAAEIEPFRGLLLGLFFMTVGMLLDTELLPRHGFEILLMLVGLLALKGILIFVLCRRLFLSSAGSLRLGLLLAQGGEFGFVLLALAGIAGIVPQALLQPMLAALIVSMIATPFVIAASDRIVLRLSRAEWMQRSLELHRIAVRSIEAERHVVIVGYGRNGQRLARLLDAEGVRYVALDLDPERVREAAAAGDTVVFADGLRREALIAAGIARAAAVVLTFADAPSALRVLAHVHDLNPRVPVIARARDEADIAPLSAAGAAEVVPEAFESGLMLASHTLVWVGVPLSRVMRRMSQVRGERYGLLRGLFHGLEPDPGEGDGASRLHSVTIEPGSSAIGRTLAELGLDRLDVEVRAVRRAGSRAKLDAAAAGALCSGDVVVLLGAPEGLAGAEERLQ